MTPTDYALQNFQKNENNQIIFKNNPSISLTHIQFVEHLKTLGHPVEGEIINEIKSKLEFSTTNNFTNTSIPTLTKHDKQLLRYFKWSPDEQGNQIIYLQIEKNIQTYKSIASNLTGALSSVHTDKSGNDLFSVLQCEYIEMYGNSCPNLLPILITRNPATEKFTKMNFSTYLRKVKESFLDDPSFKISEPKTLSVKYDEPAFFHFDPNILSEGKTVTWDNWMMGMDEYAKPIFRSYIYSIFDPENMGRQALWLSDDGYSGKSSVSKAITKFMRNVGVASLSKDSLKNQFGYSTIYGKRLVIYGDCKNSNLMQTEKIHTLLGGDNVPIERKGEQTFMGWIHAKMIVNSNIKPIISSTSYNEVSRIIYIPLHEPPENVMKNYCMVDGSGRIERYETGVPKFISNNSFVDDLLSELPAFLHKCKRDYDILSPNRGDIILPSEMVTNISDECESEDEIEFNSLIEQYIYIDKNRFVQKSELLSFFRNNFKGSSIGYQTFSKFVKYLLKKTNSKNVRKSIDKIDTKGYSGFGFTLYPNQTPCKLPEELDK